MLKNFHAHLFFAISSIGIVFQSVSVSANNNEDYVETVRIVKEYFSKNKFSDAISLLNKEIKIDGSSSILFFLRGTSFFQINNMDEAEKNFDLAVSADSNSLYKALSYGMLSRIYLHKDIYLLALENINKAIAINNKVASFYAIKSTILRDNGDPNGALKNIEAALELDPNVKEYLEIKSRLQSLHSVISSEFCKKIDITKIRTAYGFLASDPDVVSSVWGNYFLKEPALITNDEFDEYLNHANKCLDSNISIEENEKKSLKYQLEKIISKSKVVYKRNPDDEILTKPIMLSTAYFAYDAMNFCINNNIVFSDNDLDELKGYIIKDLSVELSDDEKDEAYKHSKKIVELYINPLESVNLRARTDFCHEIKNEILPKINFKVVEEKEKRPF